MLIAVAIAFWALQIAQRAPWGRVMTAIRENEPAVRAAGKDVEQFRMEGFVLGAMLMGLAGAFMAQYLKFVDPNLSDPLTATFLVWVMLVVGGSANNNIFLIGLMLQVFLQKYPLGIFPEQRPRPPRSSRESA